MIKGSDRQKIVRRYKAAQGSNRSNDREIELINKEV